MEGALAVAFAGGRDRDLLDGDALTEFGRALLNDTPSALEGEHA
jgi:hypothetical protein